MAITPISLTTIAAGTGGFVVIGEPGAQGNRVNVSAEFA